MSWEQEMQYRYQYTTDGHGEMTWQPTLVWRAGPPGKGAASSFSAAGMMDCLLGVIAIMVTIIAYCLVSHIGPVEHLSTVPRRILLGITILVSFVGSVGILETKIVKTLVKAGTCLFCGYLALLAIWHFL
jgi:hypothetical protein